MDHPVDQRRLRIWKGAGIFVFLLAAAGLWFLNVRTQGRSDTLVMPGFLKLQKIPGRSPVQFLTLHSTGETNRDPQFSIARLEVCSGRSPAFRRQPLGSRYQGSIDGMPLATVSEHGDALVFRHDLVASYRNGLPRPENSLLDATETEVEFTLSKAMPTGRFEEIRRWRRRGPVDSMPHEYVPFDGEFYGICGCSKVVWRITANGEESSFPNPGFFTLKNQGMPGLFFGESDDNPSAPSTARGNAEAAKPPPGWQFGMLRPDKDGLVPVPDLPKLSFQGHRFYYKHLVRIGGRMGVVLGYKDRLFLVFPEADGSVKEWRPLGPDLPDPGRNHWISESLPEFQALFLYFDNRRSNPPTVSLRRLNTENGRWYKAEVNPANCPVFRDFPTKTASRWRGQALRLVQKTGSLKLESWAEERLPFDKRILTFGGIMDVPAPDQLLLKFVVVEGDRVQTILRIQSVVWQEDGNIFDQPPVPAPR